MFRPSTSSRLSVLAKQQLRRPKKSPKPSPKLSPRTHHLLLRTYHLPLRIATHRPCQINYPGTSAMKQLFPSLLSITPLSVLRLLSPPPLLSHQLQQPTIRLKLLHQSLYEGMLPQLPKSRMRIKLSPLKSGVLLSENHIAPRKNNCMFYIMPFGSCFLSPRN